MSDTWAGLLQTSLEHWSKGRADLGGRGLQQAISQLQGPDHSLWRALVYNQLALLSNQMGHWQYAKEQWEISNETWRECGMTPGSPDLEATLEWYCQLLSHFGFAQRADQVKALHRQGEAPLLNPWEEAQAKPQLLELSRLPRPAVIPAPVVDDVDYAPVGGQRVASRSLADQGVQEWDHHLRNALKSAAEGKLPPALASLDKAKESGAAARARDNGHLLSLLYNGESLACFLAGDYSAAAEAKSESFRLWSGLGESLKCFSGDAHPRFIKALREAGQVQASSTFAQRHQQSLCPLLDPWSDLEVGFKTGDWQNNNFNIKEDWKAKVELALQSHARGNFVEAQKELGLLEQQMQAEDLQRAPGALLFQMQSVMAYAIGDYDSAQVLYGKALGVWDRLEPGQRKDGPYLSQLKNLVSMYGLEIMAERLGESLCDPFAFYKHSHQMERVEVGASSSNDEANPAEAWEKQLREAWEMAGQGRWDLARRRAANSERVARLIDPNDLRVAYSLNSQGIFAHAAGDYADGDQLYEDAVRGWRRGSHLPAARTAYSEFCDLLRDADWDRLSHALKEMWDKPVSKSAFQPALLPLDCLARSGMKVITAPPEPEDVGALRLPEMAKPARADRTGGGAAVVAAVLVLALLGVAGGGAWWWQRTHGGGPKASATPHR